MAGAHPEIDLRALERQAKLAQSVNTFVSAYMKHRVCYSAMTIILTVTFIAATIGILGSTERDCGMGGSVRAYLIAFMVLLIFTLIITFTFEILIRKGTILRYPTIAKLHGWAVNCLVFMYFILAVVGTVIVFGDTECKHAFYSGFVLALVLLILMYIGIAVFICLFCVSWSKSKSRGSRV